MSVFSGFADSKASFFHQLKKNQSRDWFLAHKEEFREGYQLPMEALLGDLRAKIDSAYRTTDLGEPKVFRIFRDVRFSKDKSPYKTQIGGYIPVARKGDPMMAPAAFYIQVGTESFAAAGQYMMDTPALEKYRQALSDPKSVKPLVAILKKLEAAGGVVGSAESLKKVPRGFDPEHPHAELLKRKGLIVSFPKLANIATPKFLDWCVLRAKEMRPLVEWLNYHTIV